MTRLYESRQARSWVRRWLLLYLPLRKRAWLYWLPFYFLAFFLIPFLSLAALGAYIGPDRTLGGIPAVLVLVLLAIVVRRYGIRADASLGNDDIEHRVCEGWPFPLEDPPPRRVVRGYIVSASGMFLIMVGSPGGAVLVVHGVAWLLYGGLSDLILPRLSPAVRLAIGVSAIVLGGAICLFGFGAGTRLRDRGRRLRARDARLLSQRRGEGAVLLLRSFDDEDLVDPRPMSLFQRRYEERLTSTLKQLGPVITVGRPGDSAGFAGAARFYVSSENWQDAIRFLMNHVAAVVIVVGRTEGLWWEISTAFKCVQREHLLFFFPLVDKGPRNPSLIAGSIEFVKSWHLMIAKHKKMETERLARYELFRQRSARYLGGALPADLKSAFFLDFLPDGQARVLRSRYGFLRHPIDLIPRFRRVRFNMTATLWPFMAKLYQKDAYS